jgi:hypothetical protein
MLKQWFEEGESLEELSVGVGRVLVVVVSG